jgi:hypothetical protein
MCRYPRADQTNVIVEPIPFCKLPHLIDDAAEKFFRRKCEPRKPAPPVTTETRSEFLNI